MTHIDVNDLGATCGGMKWEDFRRSPNVEDRTGMSEAESRAVVNTPPPEFPPLVRRRGDLSNQAGLDDLMWAAPWLK